MEIKINVSLGELVDKISILEIKFNKINNEEKKKFIEEELRILNIQYNIIKNNIIDDLKKNIYNVNLNLWEVEDKIRIKENKKEFDNIFIELARSVYHLNDERFNIKNQINKLFNSYLQEQKSYENYK